jgi:hypothetical protein
MPVANNLGVQVRANNGADVEASIAQKLGVARGRIIPARLEEKAELLTKKIHIFNIGPWAQVVNTGSTGSFTIPACPDDKEYVELLVADGNGRMVPPISAIMEELYPKSEDEYSRLEESGRKFAQSMIGMGRGQSPRNALTRFGVFVAERDKPTAAEIEEARTQLRLCCEEIHREIGNIYSTDRKAFGLIVRPSVHFVAAKVLNRDNPVDSPWMVQAAPTGRAKCKMCGRVVDPDVAMCEGGHIVNQELYLAAMAEQEGIRAATAPSPAR